jgi:N-acetylglutamate synthase-like GNAT family acetyltransferase
MIKIRNQTDSDSAAVQSIIAATTSELRTVYRPIKTNAPNKTEKPIKIIATIKEKVVGSAEYLVCEDSVLVRGLAVSPVHRRQGVARTIIEHVMLKSRKAGKTKLVLSTIKETGNTDVFLHMGFTIASEAKSEMFESIQGEQVTLVNMNKDITIS